MAEFIEENQITNVHIDVCPKCQQAPLKEIAQADSLLFGLITYHLLRCVNETCNTYAWVSYRQVENDHKPEFMLISRSGGLPQQPLSPLGDIIGSQSSARTLSDLPNMLVYDYDQGYQCYLSKFYDASVCMARRSLERALLGKGAKHRSKLSDMITQLSEKGILPLEVKILCEDIKHYGNLGAHSNDEPVSEKDVQWALLFTDIIITWLYGYIRPVNNNTILS